MNILQILPELNVGGVETGAIDLARHLIRQGHKPIVISGGGRLVRVLDAMGARHYQLPVHRKSLFTILTQISQVAKIIETERVDIIHAQSRVPALIAFFAFRKASHSSLWPRIYPATSFITTCHGYYSRHVFSRVMGWGKRVIVASPVMGKHMIEDFGVPSERIRLVPRGVDLERFPMQSPEIKFQKKDNFSIGIISRITPLKGHTYFIKAVSKVARVMPKIRVLIVGDVQRGKERYKEELILLVKRLGLEGSIQFKGTQADIPRILTELDVLVLATTTQEAFGRVIIEAQASGVPVVATMVGGVVSIIEDRVNGMLVPPEDTREMAEAIIEVLKDRNLAMSLAKQARKRVERDFSLKQMVDKTVSIYKETLDSFKILVIETGSIKDVMLATPMFRALRHKFPKAHISSLVNIECREIVQRCPYINEVITFNLEGKDRGIRGFCQLTALLRRACFDMLINLQNSARTHLLAYLSGVVKIFGYYEEKGNKMLFRYEGVKGIKKSSLSAALGIAFIDSKLEMWISGRDEEWVGNLLAEQWVSENSILVGINPGAGPGWSSKKWNLKNFARLADELAREQIRVVITGSKKDKELGARFLKLTKAKPIMAIGKTSLGEFACLIKHCRVFITGDTAPLYIAASVGTPCVALCGPTDPRRDTPLSRDYSIIKKNMSCSPCYRKRCQIHACMKRITVDEVLKAVKKQLRPKD